MGDVVIATAAIADISAAFPDAALDLDVAPPWDRLFEHDQRLSKLLHFDHRGQDRGPKGVLRWLREVRAARYDLIIDLQSNDHSRLLMCLLVLTGAKVPYRVGFHRRFPYNVAAPAPSPPVHAGTYARELLRAMGVVARSERPVVEVPAQARSAVKALLDSHAIEPFEYAVFLPGCQAAGYLKRWGAARYAQLASLLLDENVQHILLLGGPDEVDECLAIESASPANVLNLCGQTGLLELVPLCEGARFIVANDTGTAHLASATGQPMCIICGPTDPRRVTPLGVNAHALQADLACINCYKKHCSHHACMAMVTPRQVAMSLRALAQSSADGRRFNA